MTLICAPLTNVIILNKSHDGTKPKVMLCGPFGLKSCKLYANNA